MSKDAILHKLWTIAANHKDTYNKEDWKKLEKLVWEGIEAQKKLKSRDVQCDVEQRLHKATIAMYGG